MVFRLHGLCAHSLAVKFTPFEKCDQNCVARFLKVSFIGFIYLDLTEEEQNSFHNHCSTSNGMFFVPYTLFSLVSVVTVNV